MIDVVIIAGPTGVGKSSVAIELANRINGEIISADSVQIYRGLDIGSGKVTSEEMDGVKHHFLDICEPDESYTVQQFMREARQVIEEIHRRGRIPIICGGTGLYIHSIIYDLDFSSAPPNPDIRKRYNELYETYGVTYVYEMLRNLDPMTAENIDPKNHRRIIRAIEIALQGGQKARNNFRKINEDLNIYYFVLNRDRQKLYDRINRRVLEMVKEGLFKEVDRLYSEYGVVDGLRTIGYKEVVSSIKGEMTRDEAINKIQQHSRNYAKRQITWFKREPFAKFLDIDDKSAAEAAREIESLIGDID